MPQKSRNHELSRAALCAVSAVALVIAGSAAAHAQETGAGLKTLFDKMLSGVGLGNSNAAIDYKERPPLVVPPNRDLPPPVKSLAVKNPEWPTDPDAKKRSANIDRSMLAGDRGDEPAGPTSRPDGTAPTGVWAKLTGWTKVITGNNKESATFIHEPPRRALTDPPVGYRTPSPAAPYGIEGSTAKLKEKSDADRQAATVSK